MKRDIGIYYEIAVATFVYHSLEYQLNYINYYKNIYHYHSDPIVMNDIIGNIELKMHLAKAIIYEKKEYLENRK